MTRIFRAKAEARTLGSVTFASAVFEGPVFKNMKKTDANIRNHAAGNGVNRNTTNSGKAMTIPSAETRKYEPGQRLRKRSPSQPPSNVEVNPATTIITPKNFVADTGWPRNCRYAATQNPIPPIAKVSAVWATQLRT